MKFRFILVSLMLSSMLGCSDNGGSVSTKNVSTSTDVSGKMVFFTRTRGGCSVCHKITDQKLVGPGLAAVSNRHTDEWLAKWLKDPAEVWEENNEETQVMRKRLGREKSKKTGMKMLRNLSDTEVKALVKYLKTL